jgi:hypothetical protein
MATSLFDPFDAGPFVWVQRRLHLAPRTAGAAAWREAAVLAAVAWLPLLLLAAVQGLAWGADPRESFLGDVSAHVRYLVVIPVLVVAESWCADRLAQVARHFEHAGLVRPADLPRLRDLVASARRQLADPRVEVVIVGAAYAFAITSSGAEFSYGSRTWIAPPGGGLLGFSAAGWWCVLVSQPLFLLLSIAWLWRVAVWARFLWGVSRLDLQLIPTHPDLAAGLRFTSLSITAFAPVGFALGAVVAGALAETLLDGEPLEGVGAKLALAVAVLIPIALFAGPLLAFGGPIRRARRRGMLEYGALANEVGSRFEERWLRGRRAVDGDTLSAPDFSATTDLYSIVGTLREVGPTPIRLRNLASLVLWTLLPLLPLVLLVVPVDEVAKALVQLFL